MVGCCVISSPTSGASARLGDKTRLECRICWYVYDPAVGDPQDQIEPGTPFLDLPAHWRCPQCDSEPQVFIPVDD
ncbi:MAG: rubredoxin [Gammaproteobacteria bacterium]|nr:rubredoxin [Gammaproteobacteria bacterium]